MCQLLQSTAGCYEMNTYFKNYNLVKKFYNYFRLQVEHLQKSLEETHEMVNKLQSMLSSRTELNQKYVWKQFFYFVFINFLTILK